MGARLLYNSCQEIWKISKIYANFENLCRNLIQASEFWVLPYSKLVQAEASLQTLLWAEASIQKLLSVLLYPYGLGFPRLLLYNSCTKVEKFEIWKVYANFPNLCRSLNQASARLQVKLLRVYPESCRTQGWFRQKLLFRRFCGQKKLLYRSFQMPCFIHTDEASLGRRYSTAAQTGMITFSIG